MPRQSAGLLMYRWRAGQLEVFLAHPGGPFFVRRDEGVWSLPKGEPAANEELLACAIREFEEETGMAPGAGEYLSLGHITQKGGKVVHAWAFEGDFEERQLRCNDFELEWPPRSGRTQRFAEIDRVAFFPPRVARRKLNPAQAPFVDRLEAALEVPG